MLESGLQLTGSPERESVLNPGMEFQATVRPAGLRTTTEIGGATSKASRPRNGGGLPTATTWSNSDFIASKAKWEVNKNPSRESSNIIKSLSAGGSGHLNSKTAVLMGRTREEKKMQPPYDGALTRGSKVNPIVSKWCDEFGKEQRDYDSIALFAETRMAEAIEETKQLGVPNRVLTLKCFEVLEESAVVFGRFSNFLRLALHHITPCIFANLDKAPSLDQNIAHLCETMPAYFEITMEQEKEIVEVRQEMGATNQGLWGSSKNRSRIFAFIFRNVFRVVVRLLFRGWKQLIAAKVGRIIGFQKRSHYRWFFVWRTVMRQQRALALQAALMNKRQDEEKLYEKDEIVSPVVEKIIEKEIIIKVETKDADAQTDPVVISEVVEAPKITVSTIQKLKAKGKKAKEKEKDDIEEVLPLHKGMELVTLVYEEKLQQDIRDAEKNIAPQDLKQFCRDVLIRKYGIQSLAKKNMRSLLATTKEGALRSNRLGLFCELLGLKPKDAPSDFTPTYIPEMVEIYSKLLKNLWGDKKKNTLTACFQAPNPTVNCVALCKAVTKTMTAEQSRDPDGVKNLLERIDQLPKSTVTTDKSMSIEVNVDDSLLVIMRFWKETFQSQKAATAKGLWNSMLVLVRGIRQCTKILRQKKAAFRQLHEKKYRIWDTVVKQKAAEQQNDSGGGGNFTYMDFKKMIDDAFPSEVNERDLMDYFMEWEERFESLFEDRVDENNEKAQEAAKEVKEMENAVNEAYTKALAEAEEKKKQMSEEEARVQAEQEAKAKAVANPFGEKPAVQCSCGNIFMGDSKFCRKCGKPRPNAEIIEEEEHAIQRCEAVLASGRICGNIFAADSIFCRKCGTPRPSQLTKGEDKVDEEPEESGGVMEPGKEPVIIFSKSGRPIRPKIPEPTVTLLTEEEKKTLEQETRLDAYIAVSWERFMVRQRDQLKREKLIADATSGKLARQAKSSKPQAGDSSSMLLAMQAASLQSSNISATGSQSTTSDNRRRATVWMNDNG